MADTTMTTATGSPSSVTAPRTTYLPIKTGKDSDIPNWAMIEVNGELLEPRNSSSDDNELLEPESIELGAVHFVDEVRYIIATVVRQDTICW